MNSDQYILYPDVCNLANIAETHGALIKAVEEGHPIHVDLSSTTRVDVSFIQLCVSASRTAAKRQQPFAISGLSAAVEASFRGAGVDPGLLPSQPRS